MPNILNTCCLAGFEEIIALEVYVLEETRHFYGSISWLYALEETRHFYGSISWLCFLLIKALVYPNDYSSYSLFISLTVGHSTSIFL